MRDEDTRAARQAAVPAHRRAAAAWRCPPLPGCGSGLAGRDPWARALEAGPDTYGLSPRELVREAHRLAGCGWDRDEIRAVLVLSPTWPAT